MNQAHATHELEGDLPAFAMYAGILATRRAGRWQAGDSDMPTGIGHLLD
jgi:hypothetical protein